MKTKKYTLPIAALLLSGILFVILNFAAGAPLQAAPDVSNWITTGNAIGAGDFLGTTNAKPLIFKTNNSERIRIDKSGNVGIGTTSPKALLSVQTSGGVLPAVLGVPTGVKVGTPSGTIPLAVRQNAAESATPALAYFETGNGGIGAIGAGPSAFVLSSVTGKNLALNVNGTTRAMTIKTNAKVGIGTNDPYALLTVKAADAASGTVILSATNVTNQNLFSVYGDGTIAVSTLLSAPVSRHICLNGNVLSECNATALYVPSKDGGTGFPHAAQLVSIAASSGNFYNTAQSSYEVQKSTTPCDPNLLGVIAKPEQGADGNKKDEHYLPLALTGTHPVQVTLENGTILRGDPLTSSSKPGIAMKATGACKIIGYALEDAYTERTIQVFAHLSENSAAQVTAQQKQIDALVQDNQALKQENIALQDLLAQIDARLKALEQISPVVLKTR